MPVSEAADQRLSAWDVVRVDFPYADEPTIRRHRPALVIAIRPIDERVRVLWLLMITSARHSAWPHDSPITVLAGTGLPRSCIVRVAKVAVLEARQAVRIGALAVADRAGVREGLRALLGPVLGEAEQPRLAEPPFSGEQSFGQDPWPPRRVDSRGSIGSAWAA